MTMKEQKENLRGLNIPTPEIGRVTPRHAKEITSNNWSVGAELLDRDYTDYQAYREYMGPLGVTRARIQSGWAKTERVKGEYDFAWLDVVVDDLREQGIQPWMNVVYGNPIYGDGMNELSNGPLPMSPDARAAWCRYATKLAEQYRDRIQLWEIWNEPDHPHRQIPPRIYADFYYDTATAIRQAAPDARFMGIAGTCFVMRNDYIAEFLKRLDERNGLDLVHEISYHAYWDNPDEILPLAVDLRERLQQVVPGLVLRQGEAGMHSKMPESGAWDQIEVADDVQASELFQAKWSLRRLLGDLKHGIPSCQFTIADFSYPADKGYGKNPRHTQGLLATDDELKVTHVKQAYHALQHLTAIFDDQLEPAEASDWSAVGVDDLTLLPMRRKTDGKRLLAIWRHGKRPLGNADEAASASVRVPADAGDLVLVELVNGAVHAVPADAEICVPVWDSPVLVAEKDLIPFQVND